VGLEFAYNKSNVDPMRLSGNTINMGPMRGGRPPDYMVVKRWADSRQNNACNHVGTWGVVRKPAGTWLQRD